MALLGSPAGRAALAVQVVEAAVAVLASSAWTTGMVLEEATVETDCLAAAEVREAGAAHLHLAGVQAPPVPEATAARVAEAIRGRVVRVARADVQDDLADVSCSS